MIKEREKEKKRKIRRKASVVGWKERHEAKRMRGLLKNIILLRFMSCVCALWQAQENKEAKVCVRVFWSLLAI